MCVCVCVCVCVVVWGATHKVAQSKMEPCRVSPITDTGVRERERDPAVTGIGIERSESVKLTGSGRGGGLVNVKTKSGGHALFIATRRYTHMSGDTHTTHTHTHAGGTTVEDVLCVFPSWRPPPGTARSSGRPVCMYVEVSDVQEPHTHRKSGS